MITRQKHADGQTRLGITLLRRIEEIFGNSGFAQFTPTGPGSLATGQSGHYRTRRRYD